MLSPERKVIKKMSNVNWTQEQLDAIEYRGNSIIVSAAAGSGKTAVLVERIIRLIETVDVDRLLIVTFTKAAAAQMREGITEAIEKKLASPLSREEARHYHKQLLLLPSASITTMHSFCSQIVRSHFDKLGLSPDFSVGEPSQFQLLMEESVNQLLETHYESGEPEFLDFANSYSQSKNDSSLSSLIKELYDFVQSVPYPDQWLDQAASVYETDDIENASWIQELLKESAQELLGLFDIIAQAQQVYPKDPELLFAAPYFEEGQELLRGFLAACSSYRDAYAFASSIHFQPFRTPKGMADHPDVIFLKGLRENLKKGIHQIVESNFLFSPSEFAKILLMQKQHIQTLCNLVKELDHIYQEKKAEKNIVDFNDLEHGAIRLLTEPDGSPSPLAKSYSEEFEEIIVDEYQDTNTVQETIFHAISKNRANLFLVGDRKQSIYRFRNTAPELFSNKVETFTDDGTGSGKRVFLSRNFRSRGSVLAFANLLFGQLMSDQTCGLEYKDTERLYQGAEFPDCPEQTELYLREREGLGPDGEPISTVKQEASFIAYRIQAMIDEQFQVTDKATKQLRPVQYSDFAILLRNSKGVASDFAEMLSNYGIPVFHDDGGDALLDSMETQTLVSFLKIIDNPYQDIPLVSVLRCPVYGFSDSLLAMIRNASGPDIPFYQALQQFIGSSYEHSEKITSFLSQLQSWRKRAVYTPISRLIEDLLEETGYFYFVSSLPGGAQRCSNLRFLIETARSFESASFKGLFHFLQYLDQFSPAGASFSAPKILPDTANVVKITTIHKSKGLEYPIVIIPQLGREFTGKDLQKRLLLHKDIGFGFDYQNQKDHIKITSPVRKAIGHKITVEGLAEELRVLYVALTRAKEKTILVGTVNSREKLLKKVEAACFHSACALPSHLVLNAKSYLEWICLALVRHPCWYELRKEFSLPEPQFEPEPAPICISLTDNIFVQQPVTEPSEPELADQKTVGENIKRKLEYCYPGRGLDLFAKYSVSELNARFKEDENAYPYFSPLTSLRSLTESSAVSAAQRGSLIHLVMEKLDFDSIHTQKDVISFLNGMREKGLITQQEQEVIPVSAIFRFCTSPLGERLKNSPEIYRETPFNIAIDGGILSPNSAGTRVQLQGIIDCYFRENDRYIIIDYKTDHITQHNYQQKIKDYQNQLLFYKKALSWMHPEYGLEGYLYFFETGQAVFLP